MKNPSALKRWVSNLSRPCHRGVQEAGDPGRGRAVNSRPGHLMDAGFPFISSARRNSGSGQKWVSRQGWCGSASLSASDLDDVLQDCGFEFGTRGC